VTITNCFVTGIYQIGTVLDGTFKKYPPEARVFRTGRIKCGTESNGGFRNITISNCVFEGCQGLALESVDGALLEDISITNITMRDIITAPIFLRLAPGCAGLLAPRSERCAASSSTTWSATTRRKRSPASWSAAPRNTSSPLDHALSDLFGPQRRTRLLHRRRQDRQRLRPEPGRRARRSGQGPAAGARNLLPRADHVRPTPAHGFYIRHTKRVELSHVEVATVQPDARPTIVLDDVERADFIHLEAPYLKGQPTISVRETTGMRVLQTGTSTTFICASTSGKRICSDRTQ